MPLFVCFFQRKSMRYYPTRLVINLASGEWHFNPNILFHEEKYENNCGYNDVNTMYAFVFIYLKKKKN